MKSHYEIGKAEKGEEDRRRGEGGERLRRRWRRRGIKAVEKGIRRGIRAAEKDVKEGKAAEKEGKAVEKVVN